MRLIDADELKIKFEDAMFNDNMINPLMRYTDILEAIDRVSTAYDIDKVIEELNKYPHEGYINVETMGDIIELVKAGGKNDRSKTKS